MEIEKIRVHHFDIQELACKVLGLDYDAIDADIQTIEDEMFEQLNTDLDNFQDIVERLLPLVDVGTSELTNTRFKGFSDIKNKTWLVKTEVSG